MKKLFSSAPLYILAAAALCLAAWLLLSKGFNEIEQIRQFERITESTINTVLEGEVSVKGHIAPQAALVNSKYTATPSVYYRFLHEEERTDADGDSYWATLSDTEQAVDFQLTDATGSITVAVQENLNTPIRWSMPSSFSKTAGNQRYTEWRVEPGDQVHVFAYAQRQNNASELGFSQQGLYTPIVSKYGPQYEREQMGKAGILYIWLGLVALAFAVFCLTWAFKVHRVIAYLSALTATITLVLTQLGMTMLSQDLTAGITRFHTQFDTVQKEFDSVLIPYLGKSLPLTSTIDYEVYSDTGISNEALSRLSALKVNLAIYQAQLNNQLSAFPDNLISPLIDANIDDRSVSLTEAEQLSMLNQLQTFRKTTLSDRWMSWVTLIAVVAMLVSSYFGFRKIRFKRFIESIPTSKISGVVYGLAEIKGRIEYLTEEQFLNAPLTGKPCVWYHYKKEEKQQSGKNEKWVTLIDEVKQVPFLVSDHTGTMEINANGAEVISDNKTTRREGRYRYTERYLKRNETLYAIGSAQTTPEHTGLLMTHGDRSEPFIISNLSEQQVMLRKARNGMLLLNLSFSSLLLAALLWFANAGGLAPHNFLAAALSAPIFMLVFMVVIHYNDLIFLRQRVERNVANIDVTLQKRFDLIPNLEKSVKQFLQHETTLLETITGLRQQFNPNHEAHRPPDESSLTHSMALIIEQYPELKSQAIVQRLMDGCTQLENELAMMRKGLLDATEIYNARVQTFPDVLLAKLFGFKTRERYESTK